MAPIKKSRNLSFPPDRAAIHRSISGGRFAAHALIRMLLLGLCAAPAAAFPGLPAISPAKCFKAIAGFAKGQKAAQSAGDIANELRLSAAEPQSALFFVHSGWRTSDRSIDSLSGEVIRSAEILSKNDELLRLSASYIPLKREKRKGRKAKGLIVLSLRSSSSFFHAVYWETSLKPPLSLGESEAQALFGPIYETAYGESPEVIMDLISKAEPEDLFHDNIESALNLKELFFDSRGDKLRELVLSAVEAPSIPKKPLPNPLNSHRPKISDKASPKLREISWRGWTAEKLGAGPAAWIKSLSLEDIKIAFDSKEKIQALDMSLISPEIQVELLTGSVLWRQSMTRAQIRQLETAAEGIQYVFVPSFKHWTHDPHLISLHDLSASQIMRIDRDAFLRDVFLAGDHSIRVISLNVSLFLRDRRRENEGMSGRRSLSENEYGIIAEKLGFPESFESMNAEQRRLFFEAGARMMLDGNLQQKIIMSIIYRELGKRRGNQEHWLKREAELWEPAPAG